MKNEDLDGNVPDSAPVALLIIDMINDLEFPGAENLLEPTLTAAQHIATLKERSVEAGIPVIYVNDNFGRWRSDFGDLLNHCLANNVRGRPIANLLRPNPADYVVIKPKHSAFYATTLETLLLYMGVKRLILTGISADSCILFSANDAFVRDLELFIPADCVAAEQETYKQDALTYMQRVLKADITPSSALDLASLMA
ncbi:cysteine hydrolase [Fibrella sp. HMF5335]|uniref:Cysteine hydrolase n=1 Tax=Fibrella rubiginis TaxID=2817060 RepID=A0A939GIR3_9BACT|nr:isochorismatase family cysteine hydrolase [Fibrella rubiginis]MBO0937515.1 cysteine hydrolase [Fibrella rubiginis]